VFINDFSFTLNKKDGKPISMKNYRMNFFVVETETIDFAAS